MTPAVPELSAAAMATIERAVKEILGAIGECGGQNRISLGARARHQDCKRDQ